MKNTVIAIDLAKNSFQVAVSRRLGVVGEHHRLSRYTPIDADAVLKQGLVALDDLPRLMASGSLEERKEFMHAFVAGITVHPDEERLDVLMRKIPATALPQPGDSSVGMVAGAGLESGQTA